MVRDLCLDRLKLKYEKSPNEPIYFTYNNNFWQPISIKNFTHQIKQFAKSLISCNLNNNTKVAILGFNTVEWVVSCVATQYIGAVSVGIYPTSSKEEVLYILQHSDAEILVVQNLSIYLSQVKPIIDIAKNIKYVVIMQGEISNEAVIKWSDFMNLGKLITDNELENYFSDIKPSDIATIIYTSGTTASPKAVMLSHSSIAFSARTVSKLYNCQSLDRSISYLPLAHIAEQMFSVYAPMECGLKSYMLPSFEMLNMAIKQVRPTIFFGVPRVYEKMYDGFITNFNKQGKLFVWFLKIFAYFINQNFLNKCHKKNNNLLTNFFVNLARKTVLLKIKEKSGFLQTRLFLSGAAPLAKNIIEFFCSLDMPIYEIYGQSEGGGPTTLNYPGNIKIGTVGKPLKDTHLKIANDGEILLKGPQVFMGYYKDIKASNETLNDGWLYSGDIGYIDNDGYLHITDRKKDILITAGGKNIAPVSIENKLKNIPFIQSAVVVGDRQKFLSALFAPDINSLKNKQKEFGFSLEDSSWKNNQKIIDEIQKNLEKVNSQLASVEQIKKFIFLDHEFSIDSGELTPTLKIKRKFVNKKYEQEINKLYA